MVSGENRSTAMGGIMRRLAVLSVLAAASFAGATQEKYTISMGGQPAGTGVVSYVKLPDAGYRFSMDLNIDFAGQKVRQLLVQTFDKDALPKLTTMLMEGGGRKVDIKAVYGKASLTFSTTTNGKTTTKIVGYPPHKSLAQPSQMWFVTTRPKAHQVSNETDFDPSKATWGSHQVVYVGPAQIEMGGKKIAAFEVRDKNVVDKMVTTLWLDGHGMPYRLAFQSGGMDVRLDRATR